MLKRRQFVGLVVLGLAGCSASKKEGAVPDAGVGGPPQDAASDEDSSVPADAQEGDPCEGVETIELYDCNAQALYLDETFGPLAGVILVDYVLAGVPITLDFWHGHGGQLHAFTLGPEQYAQLRRGERTFVTTTEVDSHQHTLFIDPVDPAYRVEDALPVVVTIVDC